MSWKSYKLGELLERKRVKAKIKPDQVYKLVTIRLWHQGVVLREKKRGQDIKSNMYLVNEGDFVLSGIDARNGAFGIVPKELDGAVVTNDFWCLEPKKSLLRKDFFLFLTSTKFFDYICNQCSDGTTQRVRLQKDKFYDFEIALPPVEQQEDLVKSLVHRKKINEEISTELTHQLDLVKQLRQAFLREAMQGKLVPQDPNDEPASVLLEKIKTEKVRLIKEKKIKKQKALPPITEEEIPFEIPENWVWCRLGELGICQTGTTPSTQVKEYFGSEVPFIKPADITLRGLVTDNEGLSLAGLEKGVSVPPNSLLMVCIGGSIGKSYLNYQLVSCNQQINTITPYQNMSANLFQYWGQSTYFQNSLWKKASGGTTPIVNRSKWESIFFPLPPLTEQQRIVAKLDELMAYCDDLEASIKASQQQNELLLQQVLREALEPKEKEVMK